MLEIFRLYGILFVAEREKYGKLEAKYAELVSSIKKVQNESASLQETRKIDRKVDENEYQFQLVFKHVYSLLPAEG